jgi:Tfp pilus assembly protein PilO
MRREFKIERRTIIGGLALLLVGDVGLAAYSWNLSVARSDKAHLDRQAKQLELFRADIKRAQEIKGEVPKIGTAWDNFELKFPPASNGYSTATSDLGAIAKAAGVQIESVGFKQKEIAGRGLTEISIEAAVGGDYTNVVRFVNGIQRSERVYALDGLTLATQQQSQGQPSNIIKVAMHLKTYFRTGV